MASVVSSGESGLLLRFTHMHARVCPSKDSVRPLRPQKGGHCQGIIFQGTDIANHPLCLRSD